MFSIFYAVHMTHEHSVQHVAAAEERRVGYSVYVDTFDLESIDWL